MFASSGRGRIEGDASIVTTGTTVLAWLATSPKPAAFVSGEASMT